MRVQLFVPPHGYVAQRWSEGSSMPPLGVLFLAAVLEEKGHDVDVVPADILKLDQQGIVERIERFRPGVVGITTTTENRFDTFRLAGIVKKVSPKTVTVLGGPHISMAMEETLLYRSEADILCIGEGEVTIVELVEALENGGDLGKVKGIVYRKEGQALFTGHRPPIEDLDTLPFPARHKIPMEKYRFYVNTRDGKSLRAQNLMTSRGCPFACYFCATPVNWGRKVRGHSPERVLQEMEHLMDKYGAEFFWFYDDTLNYNPARLNKIMDGILERGWNIRFCNEFRIDAIEKPLLEKMRTAGLELAFFGIEAGARRVRREIVGKEFDLERAYRFLEWSKELDFVPNPFFIFSHDTESWQEAQETLEIMERVKSINPLSQISTAILHVYPGTPLERKAREKGIIPQDFLWSKEEEMKRVARLPAAQGEVPLYKDRLSWWQIGKLVMGWSAVNKKRFSRSKVRTLLRTLKGPKDLWIYSLFTLALIRVHLLKLLGRQSKV